MNSELHMNPVNTTRMPVGYLASIRQFQPMARRYVTSQWFRNFGSGVSHTIFNLYLISLGYSKTFLSSLLALSSFIITAAAILIMARPQVVDARAIVETGYTLELGSALLRILLPVPSVLWLGAGLESIGYSLQATGLGPLMADYSLTYERTHLFSLNQAVGIVGRFFGSIIAGVLPGWLSLVLILPLDSAPSFQLALLVWPVMVSLSILPLLRTKRVSTDRTTTILNDPSSPTDMAPNALKTDQRIIVKLAIISALVGLGAGFFMSLLNVFFWEFYSLPTPIIGLVTGFSQFASAVGVILGPSLAIRVGKVRAIIIARTLSLPFMVLLAVIVNPYVAIMSYLARSAFMDAAQPIIDCLRMELVSPSRRSLMSASHTATMNFTWGIGTAITGPLYDQAIYLPPFWFTVFSYSLSVVLFAKFFLSTETCPWKQKALQPVASNL